MLTTILYLLASISVVYAAAHYSFSSLITLVETADNEGESVSHTTGFLMTLPLFAVVFLTVLALMSVF